ncbi:MAG: isoprenylcysteine carboxylmethyltransferase family protein [Bacteroidota bacterium]
MNTISKQLLSFVLPFIVLVVVPLAIESNFTIMIDILSVIGLILVAGGMVILAITISMFIRMGKGTLAPWNPTKKLVVTGFYSHVRNPMITGVLTTLLGESSIFHSTTIFIWSIIFFIINSIYFMFSEEPGLIRRFGEEYLEYKRNVPRWIPRLKPWKPTEENANK